MIVKMGAEKSYLTSQIVFFCLGVAVIDRTEKCSIMKVANVPDNPAHCLQLPTTGTLR